MNNRKNLQNLANGTPVETVPSSAELLSALADGQVNAGETNLALAACAQDDSLLRSWSTYHLIGEMLRTPALLADCPAAVGPSQDFLIRLQRRLSLEAVPVNADVDPKMTQTLPKFSGPPVANDSNFRWKMIAGVASMAAVSAIGWSTVSRLAEISGSQVAQKGAPQFVLVSPQGPMVRDARLEELLTAHGQLAGASALRESSGFLHNTAFETGHEAQFGVGR